MQKLGTAIYLQSQTPLLAIAEGYDAEALAARNEALSLLLDKEALAELKKKYPPKQ